MWFPGPPGWGLGSGLITLFRKTRGGGGGRKGGTLLPPPQPGRVEPDISSLWMGLFSLDSVIFVVDFSDTYLMTNAENSVLELPKPIPPYKASPIPPYKARTFGTRDNVPPSPPLITKNLATALAVPHNRK